MLKHSLEITTNNWKEMWDFPTKSVRLLHSKCKIVQVILQFMHKDIADQKYT